MGKRSFLLDGSALFLSDIITGVQRLEIDFTKSTLEHWERSGIVGGLVVPVSCKKWIYIDSTKLACGSRFRYYAISLCLRLFMFVQLKSLIMATLPSVGLKKRLLKFWGKWTRFIFLPIGMVFVGLALFFLVPYVLICVRPRFWTPVDGDRLLVMYSGWGALHGKHYLFLKELGVKIFFFVHDVIPLEYPHFFSEKHASEFKLKFESILSPATGFFTNSNSTTAALIRVSENFLGFNVSSKLIIKIKVGCCFDSRVVGGNVRKKLLALVKKRPVYLTVGTVEPRKNHSYILRSFEKIWQEGRGDILIIVGSKGWKTEEFVKELESHPQKSKKLFWFENITDTELQFLYGSVNALILASVVEGYGLPILEAQYFDCLTILSDIEAFREVAPEGLFFDLEHPSDLANILLGGPAKKNSDTGIEGSINYEWTAAAKKLTKIFEMEL